jgi:hypothetical protein
MFLLFALGGTNVVTIAPPVGQPVDLAADPAKILFISLWYTSTTSQALTTADIAIALVCP